MPTLPTLTVTDAQAQRITAAFGSVANYKAWLKSQVIEYVLHYEERQFDQSYMAERDQRRAAAQADLDSVA